MDTGKNILGVLAAAAVLTVAGASQAAVTVYSGYDPGSNGVGANSAAAAAAFDAAAAGATIIDWEAAIAGSDTNGQVISPGVTLSSVGFNVQGVTTCGGVLCGDNTPLGGKNFAYSNAANALLTFTFATPISAFGAYFGGLQTSSSVLTFNDGAAQSIAIPASSAGGFAFVGFTDPGASITSLTISVPFDLISVDDVRLGAAGVPEPATWAMMILGFAAMGSVLRRRHGAVTAA